MSGRPALIINDMMHRDRPHVIGMIAALAEYEAGCEYDRATGHDLGEVYLTRIERRIAGQGGFVLVGRVGGCTDPVGYATVLICDDDIYITQRYRRHAYIADMYVQADRRGMGIGRALVNEIVRRTRAAGLLRVGIGALARNHAAVAAYAQMGFRAYAVEHVLDLDQR